MTFNDWLRRTQPLLTATTLPEHMALVRDGMELAWDAAKEQGIAWVLVAYLDVDADEIIRDPMEAQAREKAGKKIKALFRLPFANDAH